MYQNKIFITILLYTFKICANDPIENKLFRYIFEYIKKKSTLEKKTHISLRNMKVMTYYFPYQFLLFLVDLPVIPQLLIFLMFCYFPTFSCWIIV